MLDTLFKVFDRVFDRNNSYIDFNIFGAAESESAIIFHVRPIWGAKIGPQKGGEIQSF